jgi:flagellar hook assembly protein FlgD
MPPGDYRISVTATARGEAVAVDPLTIATVTGIAPTAGGTMVTLGTLGTIALTDILEIN